MASRVDWDFKRRSDIEVPIKNGLAQSKIQ